MTQDQLSNIEAGRTPLKWQAGLALCRSFNISQLWLAKGVDPIKPFHDLGEDQDWFPASESALFSFFADKLESHLSLRHELIPERVSTRFDHDIEVDFFKAVEHQCRAYAANVSAEKRLEFLNLLPRTLMNLLHRVEIFGDRSSESDSSQNTLLTDTSHSQIIGDMRSLRALLVKAQKLTTAKGKKAELAQVLGVSRETVSRYLSKSKSGVEPGGEITLRLLRWVEAQERLTQQKTPGSVATTPKGESTLRKGKVSETKPFPKSQKKP